MMRSSAKPDSAPTIIKGEETRRQEVKQIGSEFRLRNIFFYNILQRTGSKNAKLDVLGNDFTGSTGN